MGLRKSRLMAEVPAKGEPVAVQERSDGKSWGLEQSEVAPRVRLEWQRAGGGVQSTPCGSGVGSELRCWPSSYRAGLPPHGGEGPSWPVCLQAWGSELGEISPV